MKSYVLALLFLLVTSPVYAATAVLIWDPLTPAQLPVDFKEIQVFRALQTCTAAGPFAPLMVAGVPVTILKPATGAFPTTYTDNTVPAIDGQVCYLLRSVDTADNFEESNIAVKVLNLNPPAALTGLQVQSVLP